MTAQPSNPQPRGRGNPGDDMLTLQEACRFLRVAEGTLRYWRHLGCAPRSFKIGRHVRYWRADLVHGSPNRRIVHKVTTDRIRRAASRRTVRSIVARR